MQNFLLTQKLLRQAVRAVLHPENKKKPKLRFGSVKQKLLFSLLCFLPLFNLQAQTTITATGSGNWGDVTTWDNGVPNAADNVIIPAGYTVTLNSSNGTAPYSYACANLTINATGTLTGNTNTLTLGNTSGDKKILTVNGTLDLGGSVTLNLNGNTIFSTGSTFNMSGGNFNIDGNDGVDQLSSVASGTNLFDIPGDITSNVTGGTITFVDPPFAGTGLTLHYNGTSNLNWAGNTIRFGDGSSITPGPANGFNVNTKDGAGYLVLGDVIVDGGNNIATRIVTGPTAAEPTTDAFNIGGNLIITPNSELRQLAVNGAKLTVGGDLINDGTLTTFAFMEFSAGSAPSTIPQILSGSGIFRQGTTTPVTVNFHKMIVNNTSAAGLTIAVNNLVIKNELILTNGLVNLDNNTLTFGDQGFIGGTPGISNMIVLGTGEVKKIVPTTFSAPKTGSFTYPIGRVNSTTLALEYSPVTLTFTANNTVRTIGVKITNGAHPNLTVNGTQPQTDYLDRYWSFSDDKAGVGTYTYNVATFKYPGTDVLGTEANIKLNRWNGISWTQYVSTATANTLSIPTTPALTYLTAPLGGSDFTGRVNPPTTYTWTGTTTDYAVATNWTPDRTTPAANDILVFDKGGSNTVTNVTTETIGKLLITANTTVLLQSSAARTLTISGVTGDDLEILSGSALNLNSGSLSLAFTSGTIGTIGGTLTLATTSNTFNATNATVTVSGTGVINNGGSITANATNLLLNSGATYNHTRNGGTIPSLGYDANSNINITGITSVTFIFSPTSVGNLMIASTGTGSVVLPTTLTVNGNFNQSGGTVNLRNTSGASTLILKKDLNQTSGTITETSTGTPTIEFTGNAVQTISLAGVVNGQVNYNINNANGIALNSAMPVNDNATLTLTAGLFKLGNYDLSVSTTGNIAAISPSEINMIVVNGSGQVKKTFAANATTNFTYHIGEENSTIEYSPVTLNLSNGGTGRTIGVSVSQTTLHNPAAGGTPTGYLDRYWTFSDAQAGTGTYSYTASFTYLSDDESGTVANLKASRFDGSVWVPTVSGAASNVLTITGALDETTAPLNNSTFTGRAMSISTFIWDGSESFDWFDGNNWNQGTVPGLSDNVIINGSGTQPIISNASPVTVNNLDLQAGSLTLGSGSSVTVGGTFTYNTTASTNFDCISTFTYANPDSQIIYALNYGNLASGGSAARTLQSGITTICGYFATGSNNYTVTGSTIEFNGTSAQTIPAFTYHNLTSTSTGDRTISGIVKIEDSFTPGTNSYSVTGSTIEFNSAGAQSIPAFSYHNLSSSGGGSRTFSNTDTIKITGTFTPGTETFHTFGSTVEFNGSGTLPIPVLTNANYNNLIVSGTGTYSFGGNMTIEGDFTQRNGLVSVSNGAVNNTINMAGNMNLSGGTFRLISNFSATGATVNIGTAALPKNLNITGSGSINLESTSSGSGVASMVITGDLNTHTTATNALDFGTGTIANNEVQLAGNLNITGTGMINLSSTSTTSTASTKGLILNGTGIQTITSTVYHNKVPVTVNAGSTMKLGSNLNIAGKIINSTRTLIKIAGNLELAGYTLTADNTNNAALIVNSGGNVTTGNGDISGFASTTIDLDATIDLGTGQLTGVGNLTANTGVYVNGTLKTAKEEGLSGSSITALVSPGLNTFGPGSTIEYNGTASQTITARSDYQNLIVSGARGGAAIILEPGTIGVAQVFNPGASANTWTTTGNTIEFTGAAQNVPVFPYNDLTISGTGNKTLAGDIIIPGVLTMNGGILETGANKINLATSATVTETSASYITGNVETAAINMNTAGFTYTFNGIGLALSPQGANLPGLTSVRRVTGSPISANGNQGVGRYFEIVAANNSNLNVDMVFSYQDHELGANNEANLVFFKSVTSSGPWAPQSYTSRDATANTVSLTGVTGFSVWTLADENAPLPVELVLFEARKVGVDAELSWVTASEQNSQGFEIQVSANGKEFRKLGFVESHNGNTMQHYRFTDVENGKTGIRYYRLKQIDFDGKVTYSALKTVRFDKEKLLLSAYPNPFVKEVNLLIFAAETGKATLKLSDLSGKTVFEQEVNTQKGNNKITIGLNEQLPAGVYLLNARFGSEQTVTRLFKK